MANPRALALNALIKIEEQQAYSHIVLNQLLSKHPDLDSRDRHLLTELIYGTIQQRRLLDFYIEPFIKKGLDKLDGWVKQLLRLSTYQLYFLDRIPPHAVVNEAVKLAKKRGHRGIQGFVNGVLRNMLRKPRRSLEEIADPVERIGIATSHPTWLVHRWSKQYGLGTAERLCRANNERPTFTVRVNRLIATRKDLGLRLAEAGFDVEETTQSSDGLVIKNPAQITNSTLFNEGYFTIQAESSMLVAPILAPQPGMRVLDACAAPGGKTTHLAELMQNQGEVIANDIHQNKLSLIESHAQRLGIDIVKTNQADATLLSPQQWGYFDCILLDAPCSGLGVIKHKPDLKWNKNEEMLAELTELQYALLERVSRLLKVGGTLVYSTCSIDKEENEQQIERFLEEYPHFKLSDPLWQIFPYDFDSDGFFISKLCKVAE